MKFGQKISMRVAAFDERGRGVGMSEAKKTAAYFVVPGERIEGTFAGRKQGTARMADVAIIESSADRVKPECPHAGECGGCAWQHVAYARQLEEKRVAAETALSPIGVPVAAIDPAAGLFGHRNRMDYVFGPNGELGLKQPGRWDRHLDLSTCLLLSPDGFETLRRTREWAKASGLRPWDNRRHEGYLRYLVIREGKATGERLAMLVTAAGTLEKERELVEALSPLCTSIVHGINPTITDLSIAQKLRALKGEALLREKVAGVTYRIHPNAFFQTNTRMAETLLARVRTLALGGPHERLLDLYCGGGFFSLALAKDVGSALGIELDAQAIAEAGKSAEENGIANAAFRAEAAEALSWEEEKPDVAIVDPPRSGLHPKVRRTLLEKLPPRIIYVSCNVRALAADLKEFLSAYRADPAVCVDLFPHTPHVETVVQLTRL